MGKVDFVDGNIDFLMEKVAFFMGKVDSLIGKIDFLMEKVYGFA